MEYITCGWGPNRVTNNTLRKFIYAIGSTHKSTSHKSDFHNGVKLIANMAGVPSRHVKNLCGSVKCAGGYCFKVSLKTPEILEVMIKLIEEGRGNQAIDVLLFGEIGKLYRDVLIGPQYQALISAGKGGRPETLQLYNSLKSIITAILSRKL